MPYPLPGGHGRPVQRSSPWLFTVQRDSGTSNWMSFSQHSTPHSVAIGGIAEVFQRCMHQLVEGLEGVEVLADDLGCGES